MKQRKQLFDLCRTQRSNDICVSSLSVYVSTVHLYIQGVARPINLKPLITLQLQLSLIPFLNNLFEENSLFPSASVSLIIELRRCLQIKFDWKMSSVNMGYLELSWGAKKFVMLLENIFAPSTSVYSTGNVRLLVLMLRFLYTVYWFISPSTSFWRLALITCMFSIPQNWNLILE